MENKCFVKKVEYIEDEEYVYDLQMQGNHNFYVDNILVHNCIVDDPDSATKVNSPAERTKVHNFYFSGLYNRLTPPNLGIRVILQQRLHEEDLTGAILSREPHKYHHVCLPAELTDLLKPEELKEFYIDGLLDPNRLSHETLASFKVNLGSKGYTGQYLQAPAPDEGGIFKKEWFDIVPVTAVSRDPINNPIMFVLDTAYTEKQTNDPSAILTCYVRDNTLYVLDAHEVWMEFPQLVEHLKQHVYKYGYSNGSKIYVEPKASGKSLVQQIRLSTQLNIVELAPSSDSKITRANSIAPICESKRVKLVDGAYVNHFIDQLATFPYSKHDDLQDVMTYAIQRLLQKTDTPPIAFLSF